jgi:hypothetical protein
MRVSSVVAFWTHTHVVMGSNPGSNFFVSCSGNCIIQRITIPKLCCLFLYIMHDPTASCASADPTS